MKHHDPPQSSTVWLVWQFFTSRKPVTPWLRVEIKQIWLGHLTMSDCRVTHELWLGVHYLCIFVKPIRKESDATLSEQWTLNAHVALCALCNHSNRTSLQGSPELLKLFFYMIMAQPCEGGSRVSLAVTVALGKRAGFSISLFSTALCRPNCGQLL